MLFSLQNFQICMQKPPSNRNRFLIGAVPMMQDIQDVLLPCCIVIIVDDHKQRFLDILVSKYSSMFIQQNTHFTQSQTLLCNTASCKNEAPHVIDVQIEKTNCATCLQQQQTYQYVVMFQTTTSHSVGGQSNTRVEWCCNTGVCFSVCTGC